MISSLAEADENSPTRNGCRITHRHGDGFSFVQVAWLED
jgi:hypothetical protein